MLTSMLTRNCLRALFSASVTLLCAVPALADGPSGFRTALLVGNAAYEGFELPGVGASLDRVERALEEQGFDVVRHENLEEDEFKETAEEFTRSVPTGGVALVYYAGLGGHAQRFKDVYNLLRPVGVKIDNENDYRKRGLDVAEMLEWFREQSGSRVNLLFLDACWESPIAPDHDQVFAGLQAFEPDPDTLVMFGAPTDQALPVPEKDEPSALADALARHLERFDASIPEAADAMAEDAADAWFAAGPESGLGEPPEFPVAESLREGREPGEGFVNSIGMTFRWCPKGTFTMGSQDVDSPATRDRSPVEVTLSQGFWMGEHEVTQREYKVVRGRDVPRGFTKAPNAPYWSANEPKNVTEFCKKLTEIERKAGRLPEGWEYTCPTEAEWEYACRAGSNAAYCFGDSVEELGEYGNFADRALHTENPNYYWADRRSDDGVGEALAPVGSYRPNAWGLRDMHGNVAELVADHLLAERPGGTDPLVRVEKNGTTQIRGGAWCSLPLYCESSFRNTPPGRDKFDFVGFRIVLKKVK